MSLKNVLFTAFLLLLFFIITYPINQSEPILLAKTQSIQEGTIRVLILYDNFSHAPGTIADWGFSCLIEGLEKTILFDTGTKPEILLHNAEKLNVDLKKIDLIVISHNHGDHTGGLKTVLGKKSDVLVYLPFSTPLNFKNEIQNCGATVITEQYPKEIISGAYLTGEMGTEIKEQSLILDTEKGLVVITGCSHQGIVNILEKTKNILNKEIHLVLGGFHLGRHSEQEINEIIAEFKKYHVEQCGCTHCTGDKAMGLFKKAYKDDFKSMGTGKMIEIKSE